MGEMVQTWRSVRSRFLGWDNRLTALLECVKTLNSGTSLKLPPYASLLDAEVDILGKEAVRRSGSVKWKNHGIVAIFHVRSSETTLAAMNAGTKSGVVYSTNFIPNTGKKRTLSVVRRVYIEGALKGMRLIRCPIPRGVLLTYRVGSNEHFDARWAESSEDDPFTRLSHIEALVGTGAQAREQYAGSSSSSNNNNNKRVLYRPASVPIVIDDSEDDDNDSIEWSPPPTKRRRFDPPANENVDGYDSDVTTDEGLVGATPQILIFGTEEEELVAQLHEGSPHDETTPLVDLVTISPARLTPESVSSVHSDPAGARAPLQQQQQQQQEVVVVEAEPFAGFDFSLFEDDESSDDTSLGMISDPNENGTPYWEFCDQYAFFGATYRNAATPTPLGLYSSSMGIPRPLMSEIERIDNQYYEWMRSGYPLKQQDGTVEYITIRKGPVKTLLDEIWCATKSLAVCARTSNVVVSIDEPFKAPLVEIDGALGPVLLKPEYFIRANETLRGDNWYAMHDSLRSYVLFFGETVLPGAPPATRERYRIAPNSVTRMFYAAQQGPAHRQHPRSILKPEDTFVDLGGAVGFLGSQVADITACRVVNIEPIRELHALSAGIVDFYSRNQRRRARSVSIHADPCRLDECKFAYMNGNVFMLFSQRYASVRAEILSSFAKVMEKRFRRGFGGSDNTVTLVTTAPLSAELTTLSATGPVSDSTTQNVYATLVHTVNNISIEYYRGASRLLLQTEVTAYYYVIAPSHHRTIAETPDASYMSVDEGDPISDDTADLGDPVLYTAPVSRTAADKTIVQPLRLPSYVVQHYEEQLYTLGNVWGRDGTTLRSQAAYFLAKGDVTAADHYTELSAFKHRKKFGRIFSEKELRAHLPAPTDPVFHPANTRLVSDPTSNNISVVASRDFAPADPIFETELDLWMLDPALIRTHCAHCFDPFTTDSVPCPGCRLIHFCSDTCLDASRRTMHTKSECSVYAESQAYLSEESFMERATKVVREAAGNHLAPDPARVAFIMRHVWFTIRLVCQSDAFIERTRRLTTNLQYMRPSELSYHLNASYQARIIVGPSNRHLDFLLATACLSMYAFTVYLSPDAVERSTDGGVGICLSLRGGMFDHSCDPNATVKFRSRRRQSPTINMHASSAVSKGEPLYISYITDQERVLSTVDRKCILLQHYCFDCECSRCTSTFMDFT